jgi:hypothetical protein
MIEHVHFVRHHDEEAFHALGWRVSNRMRGDYAGQFSIIMRWEGEGEPRTPLQNQPDSNDDHQRFPLEGGSVLKGTMRGSPDIQQPGEGCGVD